MKTITWYLVIAGIVIPGILSGQSDKPVFDNTPVTGIMKAGEIFKSEPDDFLPVITSPEGEKADCLTCPSYDYLVSPLTTYQTHSSSIVSNGCRIYLLTVSSGSIYTFKTGCGDGATAAFDTYLELYDYSCALITYNDDDCESNRSIITWIATYSGNVYLKVRGYNSSHYGNYTLAYKSDPWCPACPAYDYSIIPALSYKTDASTISSYGCRIYYLNVTAGALYTFKTGCGDGASADFDTYLELYDSGCSLVAFNDDGCENNRSIITWTATYTGAAYLKVRAYSSYFGNYTLAYAFVNPSLCKTCPSYDFTVTPSTYFQTHSSSVVSDGCKMYAVNVSSGKQYTFKTGCGDGATAAFDTFLELLDSGCSTITYNDDGCESNRSIITWTASYSGTAYLKVRGYNSGAYGSYTLAYNEIQPPNLWLGSVDHQWENPANWSLGHVPTANEDVFITDAGWQPCYITVSNQECKSLDINNNGNFVIDNKELIINGSIIISGNFTMYNNSKIKVAGTWYSPGTFTPGPGKVEFFGNQSSFIAYFNESFNILEVNKTGASAGLFITGVEVTCQQYNWIQGGIYVDGYGVFNAYDLADNGIFGQWSASESGTINVYNYGGWIDLNGSINLDGGNLNIYGGTTYSYWPYVGNAEIIMTDGVLDFKDQGIFINDNAPGYTLTENITGGTIRTSQGFIGKRPEFTPSGGTFEFYGTSDYLISQSNGCTLHNVVINKGAKDGEKTYPAGPLTEGKSGLKISDGGKSNSISLGSDFTITGDLTIEWGSTFNLLGNNCDVMQTVDVYGILGITYPTDLSASRINWQNGSSANISNGTIHVDEWNFYPGSYALLGTGNTAYVTTALLANEYCQFGNLVLAVPAKGNNGNILNSKGTYDCRVAGNFTIQSGASWNLGPNLFVDGNAFFESGSNVSFSTDGYAISVTGNVEISGYIDLPYSNNNMYVEGDLIFNSTGTIELNDGFFGCFHPGAATLDGSLIMNSNALVSFPERSVNIGPNFNDNGMNSGTLILGGSLYALTAGTFQINSVNTEFISTDPYTDEIGLAANNWLGNVLVQRSDHIELTNDLVIKGNLNITDNKLMATGEDLTVEGAISIPHGILSLLNGSQLTIGNSMTIGTYGLFETYGVSGNLNRIYGGAFGPYALVVNNGGVIRGEYTIFEDMDDQGVWIQNGAIVDPAAPLNYCTFKNGAAGGSLLTIENTQNLAILIPVFPTNTWSGLYNVTKTTNTGSIEMNSATGAFAGPAFENDPYNRVNWNFETRTLVLKANLEGPFNGTNMNTTLNGILPLSHPFNPALPYFGNPMPEWYYAGSGSVGAIPNTNIVDWVLVELRDAANASSATKATRFAQLPAFILSNGSIVALDGASNLQFTGTLTQHLFVVVRHRNHQSIMNANLIPLVSGTYTYDFTTGASQVYGGSAGHKQLGTGVWGMRSGDGNGDGDILLNDKTQVWGTSTQLGRTGYLPSDFNFDRQTNNKDKNDKWFPNLNTYSQVPD